MTNQKIKDLRYVLDKFDGTKTLAEVVAEAAAAEPRVT